MFTLMANELEGDHQVADDNGVPKEEKKPDVKVLPIVCCIVSIV